MRRVADTLVIEALKRAHPDEFDVFARSSFNRYYYATFRIVKETLVKLDSSWTDTPHAGIPEILDVSIIRKVNRRFSGRTIEIFPVHELQKLKSKILKSCRILAELMRAAYAVRILADYRPEFPSRREGNVIYLGETRTSDAANWPTQADIHTGIILDVSRKIGIISLLKKSFSGFEVGAKLVGIGGWAVCEAIPGV